VLVDGAKFKAKGGGSVTGDGTIFVNGDSKVVRTDLVVTNGVVHIIDKVRHATPFVDEFVTRLSLQCSYPRERMWKARDGQGRNTFSCSISPSLFELPSLTHNPPKTSFLWFPKPPS
jgi:hypothetical protein